MILKKYQFSIIALLTVFMLIILGFIESQNRLHILSLEQNQIQNLKGCILKRRINPLELFMTKQEK